MRKYSGWSSWEDLGKRLNTISEFLWTSLRKRGYMQSFYYENQFFCMCEFRTGMTLWFRTVFTWRDEISFHGYMNRVLADVWLKKHTHALPVPDGSRESDFMPERTVMPRLHDIGMSFRTGVNSHRYDSFRYQRLCWYHVNEYRATRRNRSELAPVWLVPVSEFVLVSCKRIQSHKREPEWTRIWMTFASAPCKHPPIFIWKPLHLASAL